MLVRFLTYNFNDDPTGMENGKYLSGTNVKNFDRFLSMLKHMNGKDIKIGDEWYTYEGDYYLSFPKNDDEIMSLNVFVCEY